MWRGVTNNLIWEHLIGFVVFLCSIAEYSTNKFVQLNAFQ
jgi:hypothetical protein